MFILVDIDFLKPLSKVNFIMKNETDLTSITQQIVSAGKGILAADESTGTITKRFDAVNISSTERNRRDYREMLFRSIGMKQNIGGVILFDETIKQESDDGTLLKEIIESQGALPGIKVDKGLKSITNSEVEKITDGLDDLDRRCKYYHKLGAKFTKWRALINQGNNLPTRNCIELNMRLLADYASTVQENNMVPIVEPEVLMDGKHTIDECYRNTSVTLEILMKFLDENKVDFNAIILKPNMITSGSENNDADTAETIAEKTVACLLSSVSEKIPAVTFLSGGQSDLQATSNLDMMNKLFKTPWKLSFSYGRALQQSALKLWSGNAKNIQLAQDAFSHRANMNKLAALGKWDKSLETNE